MSSYSPIYVNLASESDNPNVTQLESLCMTCFEKGITKLLLTKIPHYKDVIITSFECEKCGERNNGIQSSAIQDFGVKYELKVIKIDDLSRQLVKSDTATVYIPSIDFTIPPGKGEITTFEGLISKAIEGLKQDQKQRKAVDSELFEKIEEFIPKLSSLLEISEPYFIMLDDPGGNSFVENPLSPHNDPQLTFSRYKREESQERDLCLNQTENMENETQKVLGAGSSAEADDVNLREEVVQFNSLCAHCSRPSTTKMKVTPIPHFKEVIIMATECESCGHRDSEVKSGSGIEPKGKKYTLTISTRQDLTRDVLKSETCGVSIPELELSVGAGIFVGKFTTVEGLLDDIKNDIGRNSFLVGDSAPESTQSRIKILMQDLQEVIDGKRHIQFVLDDPAGNSFMQDIYFPDVDPRLKCEEYVRTFDQNEELGLNDMVTENYGESDANENKR